MFIRPIWEQKPPEAPPEVPKPSKEVVKKESKWVDNSGLYWASLSLPIVRQMIMSFPLVCESMSVIVTLAKCDLDCVAIIHAVK